MKSLKSYSISIKIMVFFITLILIPIACIELMQHFFISENTENLLIDNTKQLIFQAEMNVDFYIKDLEDLSFIIANDEDVLEFIDINNKMIDSETIEKNILNLQRTIQTTRPEIAGIMIVNTNDEYISGSMYKTARDPFYNDDWYNIALANPQEYHLLDSAMGRNISTFSMYSEDEVITFVKAIKNEKSNEYTGIILIDMYLSVFEDIVNDIKPSNKGFIYMAYESGDIVFTPINKVAYRISSEIFNNDSDDIYVTINGKSYKVLYRKSDITSWYTVGVFETEAIYAMIIELRNYIILLTIILFGLALSFVWLIGKLFINPLIHLKNLMKKAEDGNMSVRYISDSNDEIGQLGISFNRMISEIQKLLDIVEKEHEQKIDAELRVLQAQIKPHFLYNTLDTIRWMAVEHDATNIADVIKSLTNLFRIGLSKGKDIISLNKEIEHVKSYLAIQKVRYEDEINYEIKVDKTISNYKVLKLILQPLVENAIYHGIKETDTQGLISIRCEIEDGFIRLIVEDNGIGIDKEKLDAINKDLKSGHGDHEIGYGLFNINKRIQLHFGEKYGIQIMSVVDKGTKIFITHPILFNESEIGYENNDSR